MDYRDIEKVSKALGDPYRLRIMAAVQQENSWLPCSAIQSKIDLSQPTVSHHLKQLVDAELLIVSKEGRCTRYRINGEVIAAYIRFLDAFQENSFKV